MSYYQDREEIQESLQQLRGGFIKPRNPVHGLPDIDPVIFQTYDVRAVADKYLSDRVCYYLGKGYGTFLRRQNPGLSPTVTVGGGVRLSTERIRPQLIKGILSAGVNVYDVGITSTPELYFAIPYLNADGGVNITASHNDAEDNGLKQVVRSEDGFIASINVDQMLEIKRTVLEGDFLEGEGRLIAVEEGEVVRYHNELVKANCRLGRDIWIYLLERWKNLKALLDTVSRLNFLERLDNANWAEIRSALDLPPDFEQPATAINHPLEGLKVVIDFGNGSAWRTKSIYSDLGAEVIALNETPDGSFPAHKPDPIKARYRKQLEQAVLQEAASSSKEVVGIGHDEDGDRVIYVRSDGLAVEGDRTLAIQAKSIIAEHKRKKRPGKPRFIGEVKFSRIAEEFITRHGGEYIMVPTGHAFIKMGVRSLIAALNSNSPEIELYGKRIDLGNKQPVVLAAELSGHQMSGHEENWIFDDANLAAVKVLTVIANGLKEEKTFIDLDEEVPRYPATPELSIRAGTNVLAEKQEVVDAIVALFHRKGYAIDTTDGGLIKWADGEGRWVGQALIRKSNTQPMIICRVEGQDENSKRMIENEFLGELALISTGAIPGLDLASDDYIREILPRVLGNF
jgi:phosphomannomutase